MPRCVHCGADPNLPDARFCPSCGAGLASAAPAGLIGEAKDDVEAVQALKRAFGRMTEEIAKVIVGQEKVVEELLIAMFCRGHCLLVGVPGLAKTLLVSTTARILNLTFRRIQFTPDLMPGDITGSDILQDDPETGRRCFQFLKGPIFANIVLADEINRTPPKTQAALLEAMQEHHVTSGEKTYLLPEPFFVLATQNPIEQEGTYPLPEAQLDRFMFLIRVGYPSADEETEIMKKVTSHYTGNPQVVLTGAEIQALQDLVRRVPVPDHVYGYARDIVRASRPTETECLDGLKDWVQWGAGPRASLYLILGAKARAILHGRFQATTADVDAVALPVLRHRILTTFQAEADGIKADDIIRKLVAGIRRRGGPALARAAEA